MQSVTVTGALNDGVAVTDCVSVRTVRQERTNAYLDLSEAGLAGNDGPGRRARGVQAARRVVRVIAIVEVGPELATQVQHATVGRTEVHRHGSPCPAARCAAR